MPIYAVLDDYILDDLKRKDHIIFGVNKEGFHPNDNVGYSFVNEAIEFETAFKDLGSDLQYGQVISHEVEEHHCWFHAIVTHSIREGWPQEAYEGITRGLNAIWEKHEDDIVRPMKTLWLGRGKQRQVGAEKGNVVKSMMAMADSQADLAVYTLVDA